MSVNFFPVVKSFFSSQRLPGANCHLKNTMQTLYRPKSEGFTPKLPPIKCIAKLVQTAKRRLHTQTAAYKMLCKACTDRRAKSSHQTATYKIPCKACKVEARKLHTQTAALPPIKCLAKLVQTAERRLHTQTATYKMPCKACTDRRAKASHPNCRDDIGKKSKTLEQKYKFTGKHNFRFPSSFGPLVLWSFGPLVLWSPGPLVPWSFGPLVPLVPWYPGPWVLLIPWSLTLLILVLYPSHPLISQVHSNQPEIDPKLTLDNMLQIT